MDRFYILNTLFNLAGLKFIFSRTFLRPSLASFKTLDPLLSQRCTSTAASWTSSPDAADTQSESSQLGPACPVQVLRRSRAASRAAAVVTGLSGCKHTDLGLNAPLLSLSTSSLPASRKASNTETCSCPSEACTTTFATPWTSSTAR